MDSWPASKAQIFSCCALLLLLLSFPGFSCAEQSHAELIGTSCVYSFNVTRYPDGQQWLDNSKKECIDACSEVAEKGLASMNVTKGSCSMIFRNLGPNNGAYAARSHVLSDACGLVASNDTDCVYQENNFTATSGTKPMGGLTKILMVPGSWTDFMS